MTWRHKEPYINRHGIGRLVRQEKSGPRNGSITNHDDVMK